MSKISDAWSQFEVAAAKFGFELPAGAAETEIAQAEEKFAFRLPEPYREFLSIHNGMGDAWYSPYKSGDVKLLPISGVIDLWRHMVETEAQYEMNAEIDTDDFDPEVEHPIQLAFWIPGWIPITENGCGDYFFLDMSPSKTGTSGQVVDWWHEAPLEAEVLADGFEQWFVKVAQDIHSGVYKLQ